MINRTRLGGSPVQRYLASCGLHALKIERIDPDGARVWTAETDKGRRWVSQAADGRWSVSKSNPSEGEGNARTSV